MKVTSPNHPATAAAATHSHRKTAAPASGEQFTVTAVTTGDGQTPEAPAAAKNAAAHAGKAVPPGLAKVQARLQELAASNPNRGQSNALSVINRNVARYAEQQAAAVTTPEASATPETPMAADSAATAPAATPPLASTPSESPGTPETSTIAAVTTPSETTETPETVAASTVAPDIANSTAT